MNRNTLRVLQFIVDNGGSILTTHLEQCPGFNPRIIGALCAGETPNCILEGSRIHITQRGTRNLVRFRHILDQPEPESEPPEPEEDEEEETLGDLFEDNEEENLQPEPEIEPEPEETRDGVVDIVDISINRNRNVEITCKLSKSFADWMMANGRVTKVETARGGSFCRNWDCNANTKMTQIELKGIESEYDGQGLIITPQGINSNILKIASAQPNRTWKVVYKGLVSNEELKRHAERLKDRGHNFYINYVKPIKIRLKLSVLE